jgi:DHA2 family multidrug resistance protein
VIGLVVGGGTLLWLGSLNLQAGYWDIFWPQFLQGMGMALLFVPLTTVSMANIPPQRMGYATSIFNLMRNLGGSVGIAVTGTLLTRHRQVAGAVLGEHVTASDPLSQAMLQQAIASFMAAGADVVTATQRAYLVMQSMIMRQAAMVSFVGIFRLLGVIFLVMLPLVLLMKRPTGRRGPVDVH